VSLLLVAPKQKGPLLGPLAFLGGLLRFWITEPAGQLLRRVRLCRSDFAGFAGQAIDHRLDPSLLSNRHFRRAP